MYRMFYVAALYDSIPKPDLETFIHNLTNYDLDAIHDFLQVIDSMFKQYLCLPNQSDYKLLFSAGTLIVAPLISSVLCLLLILHMARSLRYVLTVRDMSIGALNIVLYIHS